MQMTSHKPADHTQALFDTRGFSRGNTSNRLNGDRAGSGFSSVLDSVRDRQRGPSLAESGSSRSKHAQESSEPAQGLPNDDEETDDEDVESTSSERQINSHGGEDAEEAEVADDQPSASEAGHVATVDVHVENPDVRVKDPDGVAGGGEDEPEVEATVPDEHAVVNAGSARANSHTADTADADEGDDEADDDAQIVNRERGGKGQGQGKAVDGEQNRAEKMKSVPASMKQRENEQQSQAPTAEPHHVKPGAMGEGGDHEQRMTDAPTPPPHLEPSKAEGNDRTVQQREPIVFEQHDHRDHRVMPAASRVQQVESQVRLENATGQSGVSDAAARMTAVPTGGSNGSAFSGEQNGQNMPGQTGSGADRATPDDARFSGRVVRGLTAMINSRGGTMMMRLDPPELGQLRVQMTLARGTVSASFVAQTNQARVLLEKNMAALRTALESQGLTVERLNVQTSQSSSQQGHLMNDENMQRQQEQQRQDAAGGESRGKRDERDGESTPQNRSGDFADVIEQLEESQDLRH